MKLKNDFSIINDDVTFLDTGASSLRPDVVLNVMDDYYQKYGVNIHRGVYQMSYIASELFDDARQVVADFINSDLKEVVFTRGTSNSLNMVATGWGMKFVEEGDEIIVSELEHHSSILPWIRVANIKGAKLVYVPLTKEGRITFENLKSVITDRTKVIALNHVSNVMGYITPIEEICDYASERNIMTTIDAAQSAPMRMLDVKKINADFISFSGHKMLGPTGVGVLYGKLDMLNSMDPVEVGGAMMDTVTKEDFTVKNAPYKFETGTMPIAEVIGFAEAIKYLSEVDHCVLKYEKKLQKLAVEKLSAIDGVEIYNPNSDSGIVSFNIEGVHPHDTATVLDQHNVSIRAGHHCAQLLMKWLDVPATVRATFYIYNDESDVDKLVAAVKDASEFFGQF